MQNFKIEATKYTPSVCLDFENSRFIMCGQSYPENTAKFYKEIFLKFEEFLNSTELDNTVTLDLTLIYLNTSSSKAILILLDILNEAYKKGKKAVVNWRYHKQNEMAYEIGEELQDYIETPFNFIEEKIKNNAG